MAKVMWEEMTAEELAAAADATGGLCLLPIGVLEKHAEHLPLCTDTLVATETARAAAEIEPAVVFPGQHLGVITENKHHPGSVSVPTRLLLALWENLTDEIARNGFRKIVIVNGHGGNRFLIGQFIIELLDRRRDYAVYWPRGGDDPDFRASLMESEFDHHGGELETSLMLHLAPEACRPDRIGALDGTSQRDFDLGGDVYASADWYSRHPTNYAGDATAATADKGRRLLEHRAERLAKILAAIKADRRVGELLGEFYDQCER